jgi:hypothetical protein
MASRATKPGPKKGQATESVGRNVSERADGSAVELLAYQIWQDRGSPIGSVEDDWFQAENELRTRAGQAREV